VTETEKGLNCWSNNN